MNNFKQAYQYQTFNEDDIEYQNEQVFIKNGNIISFDTITEKWRNKSIKNYDKILKHSAVLVLPNKDIFISGGLIPRKNMANSNFSDWM